mgnify:CR=1 FL=1
MGKSTVIIACLAVLAAWGCKKPDDIGTGLISGANVEYSDSIDVVLTTFRVDDARTAVPALGFFGQIQDPVMGLQTAAYYTQFLPLQDDINLKNAELDSLVLVLDVTGFRGERRKPLTLQIHELADSLGLNTPYVIGSSAPVKGEELSGGFRIAITDSVLSIKKFSVRLSDALGMRLLGADSAFWARPANFKNLFYGLRIGAVRESPGDVGCIYVSNLQTVGEVSLVLHYRVPSGDTTRAAKAELFAPRDAAGFYSLVTGDNPDALAQKVLNAQNPESRSYAVMQEGGQWLVRVSIDSAGVAKFANAAVNRAQLVLTVHPDHFADTLESVVPTLPLLYHAANRQNRIDSAAVKIEARRIAAKSPEYLFDLGSYFQQYVRDKKPFTDFVVGYGAMNIPNLSRSTVNRGGFARVVFGGKESEARPKIRLFYTRAPE